MGRLFYGRSEQKGAVMQNKTPLSPDSDNAGRLSRRNFLSSAMVGGLAVASGSIPDPAALGAQRHAAFPALAHPSPVGPPSAAEAKKLGIATLADYQRAVDLWAVTDGKVRNENIQPHWLGTTGAFWYMATQKNGALEYIFVDPEKNVQRHAFDRRKLSDAIAALQLPRPNPDRLSIDIAAIADDEIKFNCEGAGFSCDLRTYEARKLPRPLPIPAAPDAFPATDPDRWSPANPVSPDGRWMVIIRDYNVILQSRPHGRQRQLTTYGVEDDYFEPTVFWSPDSQKFIVLQTVPGFDRQVKELDYAVPQNEATLISFYYQKPGDRVTVSRPHLFHVTPAREIPLSTHLAPNPWSITEIRWNPDSRSFTYLYNQRGHQIMRVLRVDAHNGRIHPIVEEICHDDRSPKFFDYSGKQFTFYLPKSNEMIWMSERDGWNHLYLFDLTTGQLKNRITSGPWVVRSVLWVDPEKRQVWLRVGGIYPSQDPYFVHYCRVNFDGTQLKRLTDANGTHKAVISPDRRFLVAVWSRVDSPPVTELRSAATGHLIRRLETADITELLATGLPLPQPFRAKGRDGKTDIYGVIYRPTNFNPHVQYPVIEHIYAGPQGAFVPKEFRAFHWPQTMAEIGFIVVQIDGMGTSQRSKPFHDVCWKNLGDSGFPDRIPWIKAAQRHACPQMDLSRMGIYGTSAGGQSAMRALVAFGDFYKVASANSGCHDNRVDKIWWNEQWMGWPIGPWYADQSNVTNAHKLNGPLQLIAGGMDHNVDPCCTMQVINALQIANKDFEFIFVPPGHHGAAGYHWQYTWRQVRDFMVRKLWHIEPRDGRIMPLPV
jgi:dipeptidyl-peptidase-4